MPSLQTHLNSLNFSHQLGDVKALLDSAKATTTFWGSRVVKVNGYTGSVYLSEIARKVLDAGSQRSDADDLLTEERIAGLEIVKRLISFYRTTDTLFKNSNWFTRFLRWFREFSFVPYTVRFYVEEVAEDRFRTYSAQKFLQQFGGKLDEMDGHPASYGSMGPPLRIMAKDDRIRALISQ